MVGPSLRIRKELEYPPPPPWDDQVLRGGGQILFKHPYRSVLMGGSEGETGNHKLYGFYRI